MRIPRRCYGSDFVNVPLDLLEQEPSSVKATVGAGNSSIRTVSEVSILSTYIATDCSFNYVPLPKSWWESPLVNSLQAPLSASLALG